jgi:Kef-type K+ transport system membrane component KefB
MAIVDPVLQAIEAVSLLLLGAKLMAELFARLRIPVVLGELSAGIILGPLYFGGLLPIGTSLIQVNQIVLAFAQIGAIVILFIAGLEMPFRDFVRGGIASFTVGGIGVILPFVGGFTLFLLLGFGSPASLIVGTALTATSIAISVETLREMKHLNTPEGKLIVGAAVVDDVLAVAALGVVGSAIASGRTSVDFLYAAGLVGSVLLVFAALIATSLLIAPRLTQSRIWKTHGSTEAVVTALFFGMAAVSETLGLSPILGSFAVGMALAGAQVVQRMQDYVEKLQFIFRPLFFAVIGAQVNLGGLNPELAVIGLILILVAVFTKFLGCGLPARLFLKSKKAAETVGAAMISRGEIGLIVVGVGVAQGIIDPTIYSLVVITVIATTIISPLWLRRLTPSQKSNSAPVKT